MDVHYLADEISQNAQYETILFLAVCTNNVTFLSFDETRTYPASLFCS